MYSYRVSMYPIHLSKQASVSQWQEQLLMGFSVRYMYVLKMGYFPMKRVAGTLSIKQNTLPSSLRIHRHKFLQKANKYGFTSIINYHKNHSQVWQNHITSVASFLTFNVICTPFLKFCNSLWIFATVIYSLKYLLISFRVFLYWKLLHIEKNAKEF